MIRALLVTLALIVVAPLAAEAQQPGKVYRIGFIGNEPAPSILAGWRTGLREYGWVEGQNIAIEYRWVYGKRELFPDFAAEMVRLKVDVIVAATAGAVMAAKRATTTIPVVMASMGGDPVALGLITSLSRPGGNITGVDSMTPDLAGKRLELIIEAVPKVSRVAVLWKRGTLAVADWEETKAAAQVLSKAPATSRNRPAFGF